MFTRNKYNLTIVFSFLIVMFIFTNSLAQDSTWMNIIDGYQGIGELTDVDFLGQYLIAAAGASGILLVDDYLSDSPQIVLQVSELYNSVQKLVVDGNMVYALGHRLDRYDFSDPLNPVLIDSNPWNWSTDEVTGYYIFNDRLIYSVYHDIMMVSWDEDGFITRQSLLQISDHNILINNYKLLNNFIYLTVHYFDEDYEELMVWNIEDPDNAQPVEIPEIINELPLRYIGLSDNYLVLSSGNNVLLLDNSDPEDLALLDSWTYDPAENSSISTPRIFDNTIMCNNYSDNGGSILTFGIDSNNQITFVSETPFDGIYYMVHCYNDNYTMWLRYDVGLTIVDTSNPAAPVLSNIWDPSCNYFVPARLNDNIFTSTYATNDSIQIFDFSNNNHVHHSGEFLPDNSWGASIVGTGEDYLVLRVYSNEDPDTGYRTTSTQLAQVDQDNPGNLILRGVIEEDLGLYKAVINNNALYSVSIDDSTFRMYNISNPDSPFMVDAIRFPTYNQNYQIILDNERLYLGFHDISTNTGYHFQVYDLVDPFVPALLVDTTLVPVNSFLVQDTLLIVESSMNLYINSIANLDSIYSIEIFEQPPIFGNPYRSKLSDIQDGFIILSSSYGQSLDNGYVQIIDISFPFAPEVAGSYSVPGEAKAIFADDKIFATWGSGYGLFSWNGTQVEENTPSQLPDIPALSVYPNPANPTANISLMLPQSSEANIRIYDILGREVYNLYSGQLAAGRHQFMFGNSEKLSSGLYFVQAKAGNWNKTEKIIFIK